MGASIGWTVQGIQLASNATERSSTPPQGTNSTARPAKSLAISRSSGTIRWSPENKIAAYLYAATSFPGGA
jgi:hypothetical protein